jgi:hypothetical protein
MAGRGRRSSRVHSDTRQSGKTVAIVGILFVMVAVPLFLTSMGLLVLIAWLLAVWGLGAVVYGLLGMVHSSLTVWPLGRLFLRAIGGRQ